MKLETFRLPPPDGLKTFTSELPPLLYMRLCQDSQSLVGDLDFRMRSSAQAAILGLRPAHVPHLWLLVRWSLMYGLHRGSCVASGSCLRPGSGLAA